MRFAYMSRQIQALFVNLLGAMNSNSFLSTPIINIPVRFWTYYALPYIHCGGWILLHDITLGSTGVSTKKRGKGPRCGPFGAEWLFAEWPFRKISSANIGAVQMPGKKTAIIPMALRLMKLPFEMSVATHRKIRRVLYENLAELL